MLLMLLIKVNYTPISSIGLMTLKGKTQVECRKLLLDSRLWNKPPKEQRAATGRGQKVTCGGTPGRGLIARYSVRGASMKTQQRQSVASNIDEPYREPSGRRVA